MRQLCRNVNFYKLCFLQIVNKLTLWNRTFEKSSPNTAKKSILIRSFSGAYSVRMRGNTDQKIPNTDTFYAVQCIDTLTKWLHKWHFFMISNWLHWTAIGKAISESILKVSLCLILMATFSKGFEWFATIFLKN